MDKEILKTGQIDSHGDILMPGCFKSINSDIKLLDHDYISDIMAIYGIQPELLGTENAITVQPPEDGCSRLAAFGNIVEGILK